ncbi:hypothetical protein ACFJIW_11710 [Tahibacter sp. UC22_41]|uniref:hypothetical protein n=1 Tax=Tahibacter sp. UC22_41 TaxID=3350178 RepID=UPI0036D8CC38
MAALEADATPESETDRESRVTHLLLAIKEQLSADLTLLSNIPEALNLAFAQLQEANPDPVMRGTTVMWVDDESVPHPLFAADEALMRFRVEIFNYLDAVIAGLDGSPPAPGKPAKPRT